MIDTDAPKDYGRRKSVAAEKYDPTQVPPVFVVVVVQASPIVIIFVVKYLTATSLCIDNIDDNHCFINYNLEPYHMYHHLSRHVISHQSSCHVILPYHIPSSCHVISCLIILSRYGMSIIIIRPPSKSTFSIKSLMFAGILVGNCLLNVAKVFKMLQGQFL